MTDIFQDLTFVCLRYTFQLVCSLNNDYWLSVFIWFSFFIVLNFQYFVSFATIMGEGWWTAVNTRNNEPNKTKPSVVLRVVTNTTEFCLIHERTRFLSFDSLFTLLWLYVWYFWVSAVYIPLFATVKIWMLLPDEWKPEHFKEIPWHES